MWVSLKKNLKKNNFMAPFYGWGSTASRLQPLRGGSLLFTIQFPLTCNVRNAVKYWIILYRKSSNNVNVVSPTFHQWWLLCDCYFLIFNIVFIHRETFAFCFVLFLLFFLGGGRGFRIYGFIVFLIVTLPTFYMWQVSK